MAAGTAGGRPQFEEGFPIAADPVTTDVEALRRWRLMLDAR
jgi:hypothetical protein